MESPSALEQNQDINTTRVPMLGISIFLAIVLIPYLHFLYNLPVLAILKFYFGVLVFLYLPGVLILDVLHWEDNSISMFFLSILAGVAITPILYYLAAYSGYQWLYILTITIICFYVLYIKKPWTSGLVENLVIPRDVWKPLLLFAIVLGLLHCTHFKDLKIVGESHYQVRVMSLTETIFHLGVTNAVKNDIPPVYPYASGYNFAEYHIDMHILGAIFAKYLELDTILFISFFMPMLLLILIVAIPAVFFYSIHRNLELSLVLGLLMFGADFSFIPALLHKGALHVPWTAIFCPTICSIFTVNGIMPAIPLFFGALLAYQRFFATRNTNYLIVFSLFTISACRMKSSMGLQILGAAFLALAFIEWRQKCGIWRKALLVLLPTVFLVAVDLYCKVHDSTSPMVVKFDLFNGIHTTAKFLGWSSWETAANAPLQHPFILIYAVIVFLIGCMGVRILFLKYFYDVFKDKDDNVVLPFLIFFVMGGMLLAEVLFIGGQTDQINNSVWFRVQSIIAATYFVTVFIATLKVKRRQLQAVILVLYLMIPSTLEFMAWRNQASYIDISSNEWRAVEYIDQHFPAKCTVLEFPMWDRPSLTANFTGRSTVFSYYLTFINAKMSPSEIYARAKDQKDFFANTSEIKRRDITAKYGVEYLVVPTKNKETFDSYKWLTTMYENPAITIYKVHSPKSLTQEMVDPGA
ncbi:MAG: hypothetical protein ACM3UZ_09175 [Acidobacteriota bacterium]